MGLGEEDVESLGEGRRGERQSHARQALERSDGGEGLAKVVEKRSEVPVML